MKEKRMHIQNVNVKLKEKWNIKAINFGKMFGPWSLIVHNYWELFGFSHDNC